MDKAATSAKHRYGVAQEIKGRMRQIHNDPVCYASKLRGQVFSVAEARLDVMQSVQFDIVLQAAKGIGILLKSNPFFDFLGQQYRKRPNAGKHVHHSFA